MLVRLREVVPEVVRVIDVPAASTLAELHELLQAGVGWTDSHLHQFVAGHARYGVPHEDRATCPSPRPCACGQLWPTAGTTRPKSWRGWTWPSVVRSV